MRRLALVPLLLFVAGMPACGSREPEARPNDGVLVLELGGDSSSLRGALRAAGVLVEASAPKPVMPSDDVRQSEGDERDVPDPRAPAPEPPASDHMVVALGRGETLMHLAKQHLGSGLRYREILEANGWTEADAKRLREGQAVKIPLDRTRSSTPR